MGALHKRLRALVKGLRSRWLGALGACRSTDPGDRISLSLIAIWLACVPIAVWMAAGEPPLWLAYLVIVTLWGVGLFFFLILGLPPLTVPFALIWYAFPRNRTKAGEWIDPSDEWQSEYEDLARRMNESKDAGSLPEDYELPPIGPDDIRDFRARLMSDGPTVPALRPIAAIAAVVLIIALYADGRPVLATLYVIMLVGWPLAEGIHWLLLRWRGA